MGLTLEAGGGGASPPIGVFDSGVGGLTVLGALLEAAPNQAFLYLGDAAHAPYGERAPDDVLRLTIAGVERLFEEGCRLVVIACNTASALALRRLQQEWLPERAPERRVLGVFAPIVEAITGRRWSDVDALGPPPGGARRALFFATPATVASGAFEREAARRATDLDIVSEACGGLVDALERADRAGAEAIAASAAERALARAGAPHPAFCVLGCTHYPIVRAAFRRALPDKTEILSQPGIVAGALARYLERRPDFEARTLAAPPPRLRCLTTGAPDSVSAAASLFFERRLRFDPA